MARIRSVKPSFWQSGSNAKLSREARLLYIGLWSEADDEGRLIGSIVSLIGNLFPHDADVTPARMKKWLAQLTELGKVIPYDVDGITYLLIPTFTTHQKISHPTLSVLPNPPAVAPGSCRNGSGTIPESFGPDREGIGEERESAPHLCPEPFVIDDALKGWARENTPKVDLDDLAQQMVLWSRSKGKKHVSWRRTLQSWARDRQKELAAKPADVADLGW